MMMTHSLTGLLYIELYGPSSHVLLYYISLRSILDFIYISVMIP